MRKAVDTILEYGSLAVFTIGVLMIIQWLLGNYNNFGIIFQNIFQVWGNIL